jgi:L-lysine 6-transaminase
MWSIHTQREIIVMSNIARGSIFNIKVDFEKSQGSYVFDKRTNREYLDFFGMYASLPLGYNHGVFKQKSFIEEIIRCSHIKVTNCEFISEETEEFDNKFSSYCGQGRFSNFHYCSTGALAVEAAVKTCLHYKNYSNLNILSFKNSFHGVNSYGGFITDRFYSSKPRLRGLPEMFSTKCSYDLEEVEKHLSNQNNPVTCVMVEPIQCTAGDIHHDRSFFHKLRVLCDKYDVPLVFDEIQIGFGTTGKLWFFEHLDITPDIVLFGKKAQVSGFMCVEKVNGIFHNKEVNRLEVTWNSDTLDMIRCKYILEAMQEENFFSSISERSKQIVDNLSGVDGLENLRTLGLIIGFDLKDTKTRDEFMKILFERGMICNSTGERSIRLRPILCLTEEDANKGCDLIKEVLLEV